MQQFIITSLLVVFVGLPLIHVIKFLQKILTQRRLNHFLETVSLTNCVKTKEFKYNPESGKNKYEAFVRFKDEPDILYKISFGPRPFVVATHVTAQKGDIGIVSPIDAKYLKYDNLKYNVFKNTGHTK